MNYGKSPYLITATLKIQISLLSHFCTNLPVPLTHILFCFAGTQLLDCPQMEAEIKYCQSKQKKIILSMGGATPAYGISSMKEGEDLADELWNTFAGGKGPSRPFGDVSIDGFDLDIENGEKAGYTAFVNKMRKNYETDTSKTYYIAAAPQCPYPDYFVGDTLNDAWIDFVMIQFYNNYCNVVNTAAFNYHEWDTWAQTRSVNKNVRLFVGIPGSPTAANRGYVPYTQLVSTIQPLQSMNSFGGIMVWDVSQAYGNTQDVLPHYAQGITRLIKGKKSDQPSIELAPVTIGLSPEGTTVAIPTPTLITVISTVTSTLQLSCLVTRDILYTTHVPSTATPGVLAESVLTMKSCVTPDTSSSTLIVASSTDTDTISSRSTHDTLSMSSSSSTDSSRITSDTTTIPLSTSVQSLNVAPADFPTTACDSEGLFQCRGSSGFSQCVYGHYVFKACPPGTVCKENSGMKPASIFCDFP
ncbi:hypothetical protein INT47_005890 [Mucor saturninus]|uniref:chitinase n=1 Tax=Mucor saturninus TaxID=64648 RepID=A0A8H7R9E0_9FUNG|nr:hypothetical protein INT47_005890 [Mucor saturninus]